MEVNHTLHNGEKGSRGIWTNVTMGYRFRGGRGRKEVCLPPKWHILSSHPPIFRLIPSSVRIILICSYVKRKSFHTSGCFWGKDVGVSFGNAWQVPGLAVHTAVVQRFKLKLTSDQPSPLLHKAISQAQGQGQCTIKKMGHSHITQRNNEGGYRAEGVGRISSPVQSQDIASDIMQFMSYSLSVSYESCTEFEVALLSIFFSYMLNYIHTNASGFTTLQ